MTISILVIDHNLDVFRCGGWVIDLGPEGGDKGGEIVVAGTPEEVAGHSPRFQERCHPSRQYTRGLEDMTNASLQRGRQG